MSVRRDDPYLNFNFLVDLGGGDPGAADAGFQEVTLPTMSIDVVEYRTGNDRDNAVRKLTGLHRTSNLVLKRGIIGSLTLYQWFDEIRNGNQATARTVTVQLLSEDRSQVVMTWRLLRARIVKIEGPTLSAKGNDVAVESVEIMGERLELE